MTDDTRTTPAPDWAHDWGKVPYNPMQERAAFNIATGGPRGMIPRSEPVSRAEPVEPVPPNDGGGRAERELGPPPGAEPGGLIDRMCISADQRERQQAQAPDMMTQMMTMMMQQQTQMLALLAHLTNKEAAKTQRPKAKGKKP